VKDPTNPFRQGLLLRGSDRRHVDGEMYDRPGSHPVCDIGPDNGSPASLFERECSRGWHGCFVFVISFVSFHNCNKIYLVE